MNYVIGIGGIAGTLMLAFALFGGDIYPRWRRWVLGLTGLALAISFWIIRPTLWDYGESICDPWDGGHFDPSC